VSFISSLLESELNDLSKGSPIRFILGLSGDRENLVGDLIELFRVILFNAALTFR